MENEERDRFGKGRTDTTASSAPDTGMKYDDTEVLLRELRNNHHLLATWDAARKVREEAWAVPQIWGLCVNQGRAIRICEEIAAFLEGRLR